MLVVAPLEAIEAYASVLRDCQLKPCSIEIKGFSLERVIGLQYPELRQSGTYMVVDVHGAAADVSIYDEGKLRITRSVLVSFRDMEPTDPGRKSAAVGLFAEYEAASESDFEQAGEALAVELERMMSFYRYSLDNRTKEMARIIVTGDVERLADIAEMLNERLSRPAEVMRPFTDSPVPSAAYAVPIGLALRGRRR